MSELIDPPCPKCETTLRDITSDIQLCSYPPYKCYKCHECDFAGYVMMKMKSVPENQEPIAWKLSSRAVILNNQWVDRIYAKDNKETNISQE